MRYDDWNDRVEGVDGDDCDYRCAPSFKSTANPDHLQAIFDKAAKDGAAYRARYGNPWDRLNRGQLADMDKKIADANAESRTMNGFFKRFE